MLAPGVLREGQPVWSYSNNQAHPSVGTRGPYPRTAVSPDTTHVLVTNPGLPSLFQFDLILVVALQSTQPSPHNTHTNSTLYGNPHLGFENAVDSRLS